MKITLIDVSNSHLGIGIRHLSSYLKKNGHETELIFLPDKSISHKTGKYVKHSEEVIRQLAEICKDSDFIGLSVFSNFYLHAVDITIELKKLTNTPIIWGGVHPTVDPESSIKYADAICIGEGEESCLEFLNSPEKLDTPGFWFKKEGKIIKNKMQNLETNLDKYPGQDYDIKNHHYYDGKSIKHLDKDLLMEMLRPRALVDKHGKSHFTYYILTSRGCPYRCAYCCNNAYTQLYGPAWGKVRRRSADSVIAELKEIKSKFPFFHNVAIVDDPFMVTTDEEIVKFADAYKREIGMPFRCITTPTSITEKKMESLVAAGMYGVEMGIQTGSNRVNQEVYHRFVPKDQVIKAAYLINKYPQIVPRYDIIMDCPWESEEDVVETINLVSELPKPHSLSLFSLTFYPGTELAKRAAEEGKIKDMMNEVYLKPYSKQQTCDNLSYTDFVLMLGSYLPNKALKFLMKKEVRSILGHKSLGRAYTHLYKNRNKTRKIATMLTNPWSKRVSKDREFDA